MKPITFLIFTISSVFAAPDFLDTLTVTSTAAPSLTQPGQEQDKLELAKIPGGTESFATERYLTGRASTFADVFALSPGVIAQSRFGSDEARISIRGSGLQRTFHGRGIRLLQDGIPLNLADGGFDMQTTDPLASSHIKVLRGGNALSHGSTTLGGAIDYISHSGLTAPGHSLRTEAGSQGYFRTRFAGGYTEGSSDLYFSASHASQDGFRDHAEQDAQRIFANFGIRLRDDLETRLFLIAVHTDSELPGSLTKAEMNADPSLADNSFFGAKRYDNRRDYELFRLANKTTLRDGNNTWDLTAGYTYKDLDHPITPFAGVLDQLSQDLALGAVFTNTDEILGRGNRFRSGLSFTYGNTASAAYVNNLGRRGALRTRDDQTAANIEAFVDNRHQLSESVSLTTSLAAAYSTRRNDREFSSPGPLPQFTPPAANALVSYDDSYANIAPGIGLLHEKDGIQWFAGITRSFEPPSFSEAVTANTARDAQSANTIEAGTRGTRSFVRWDATGYYSEVKDELLTLTDPVTLVSTTANADETIHQGIELGLEFDLLGSDWSSELPDHRLVLRTAYTYGSFRFDDDSAYGSNRIAGLPPHLLRSELLWENNSGYYAPTFEWVPVKSFIDHRNTFAADPYALLGFKFGRQVSEGVSWFVEAKNLTDEIHAATHGVIDNAGGLDQRQFLPGDGRSVYAGIEWKY